MLSKTVIITVVIATIGLTGTAAAETDSEKIDRLEQEIKALKDVYIEGAPRRIKRIADRDKEESKWSDRIEVGALIEVEAGYVKPYEGDSESDIVVATFAPFIASQVNDWIRLQAALLYEQDNTDLEVDIATVTITNAEKTPVHSIIGQTYMPFGNYDTHMVSDPLTLDVGESREVAIQLGVATFGVTGTAYVFNGDLDDDEGSKINDYGAFLGFNKEFDWGALSLGLGYISSFGESDTLQEGITFSDSVSGAAANTRFDIGSFSIIGEYVGANSRFELDDYEFAGNGAKPSAFNIEAGYTFNTAGKESIISIAYQGSRESIAIGLPESRAMIGYAISLMRNTGLLFEYAYDTDYSIADGGTGENASRLLGQLAVVF